MDNMNITSAQYENDEINGGTLRRLTVVIDGETVTVPQQAGNRHYAEIMRQVDAGTLTIEEAD
jgi:hypothetical protein